MIIGNGDIASALNDREDFVFIAAGVSNSQCNNNVEFTREKKLLTQFFNSYFMVVYFGSISVYLKDTPYTNHKKDCESLIKKNCNHYCIIRLGNIDWGNNPNTFINYIKAHPDADIRENEMKYMISKDQLNFITDNLPRTGKHEISVFGEMLKVKDCLQKAKSL